MRKVSVRLAIASGLVAVACMGVGVPVGAVNAATVNTESVRRQIATLVEQTYTGLPTGNVACPSGLARKAGASFACTVQLPGTFLVVGAEQLDGNGRLRLSAQQAVLPRAQVEQFVASQATVTATVSCGPAAFIVLRPGQKFGCRASIADGSVRQVELVVQDIGGNVAITAVG